MGFIDSVLEGQSDITEEQKQAVRNAYSIVVTLAYPTAIFLLSRGRPITGFAVTLWYGIEVGKNLECEKKRKRAAESRDLFQEMVNS